MCCQMKRRVVKVANRVKHFASPGNHTTWIFDFCRVKKTTYLIPPPPEVNNDSTCRTRLRQLIQSSQSPSIAMPSNEHHSKGTKTTHHHHNLNGWHTTSRRHKEFHQTMCRAVAFEMGARCIVHRCRYGGAEYLSFLLKWCPL